MTASLSAWRGMPRLVIVAGVKVRIGNLRSVEGGAVEPRGIRPPFELLHQRWILRQQSAAEQVRMAVEHLGRRMEHEVAAQLERPLPARRKQRVVGKHERAALLRRGSAL